MAGLELYKSDNSTSAAGAFTIATSGGVASTAQVIHAWYNKGTAGGSLDGVYFQIEIEDPGNPGTYLVSGLAALNGHMEARINGGSNAALASGFVTQTTDWVKLGPGSVLQAPRFYGNTSHYVEARYVPPLSAGAATASFNWKLVPYYSQAAFEVPTALAAAGSGVVTGVCDRTVREFVETPSIVEAGTPDATVIVSRSWWIWDGVPYRSLGETITLNQNDSAVAALTTGQAYIAVLSRDQSGTALTVTKGVKATAAAAVAPSVPAGEIPVARIIVNYHSGASVITNANITKLCLDGRMKPRAGSALTGVIGAGRAIMSGAFVRLTGETTVTLTNSATNRVWLTSSGTFTVVTTDDLPPVSGALWIATFVTSGGVVTTTTDKRTFYEPLARVVRLRKTGSESTGANADSAVIEYAFCVDRMTFAVGVASIGATGSTVVDLNKRSAGTSTTVFTNQGGATESRPKIAAQALTDFTGYPEVTTGEAGDWLILDHDTATSGGTQAVDLGLAVVIYPR